MKPWQAILAIVPAGLLMGLAAGKASHPVMQMQDERPWPRSVDDKFAQVDSWSAGYEAGPQDLSPYARSYRPDLDYSSFAWPDQDADDAEMFAAVEYDYGPDLQQSELNDPPLPQVHRVHAELAAKRAQADAVAVETQVETASADQAAAPSLPPVPPPLVASSVAAAPPPVAAIETEAF